MEHKNKKLIIIAGAAGEIGTAFCESLSSQGIDCIAVVRNRNLLIESPFIRSIVCNLDDEQHVNEKFSPIRFEQYDQVIYLHTIGVDKFDPRGYPNIQSMKTIDADVYNTNVNSFKYLMRFCLQKIRLLNENGSQTQFKIAIIAGVADKYTPFVIESFCEAKYIVRQYIQSSVGLYPTWVSGLSINITSTITESALAVRPYADTQYWLTPNEVVSRSINQLLNEDHGYQEIDLIKNSPKFIEGYYEDKSALYKKWSKETGIK